MTETPWFGLSHPAPCERCDHVRWLMQHKDQWLCASCNPGHTGCDVVAGYTLSEQQTSWTCPHRVTYSLGGGEQ